MLKFFKKIIRNFFIYSKAEQYGIVALSILILFFLVLYFLLPGLIHNDVGYDEKFASEVEEFLSRQQEIRDSIDIARIQSMGQLSKELAKQKIHPFPFDPNQLPEEQWRKLGLTPRQISVIKNYEAKGGKFYTKDDLKKIYCISEAEYEILEPYIVIKLFARNANYELITSVKKPKYKLTELNSADSSLLTRNLKLPGWVAIRIIKYRNKLGGFYDKKQLLEVYGMKEKYYRPISKYVYADTLKIRKICINNAGFKQVLHHPYFDYELTKLFFKERRKHNGSFDNLNQALNIISNDSLRGRLSHYLYICAPDARNN